MDRDQIRRSEEYAKKKGYPGFAAGGRPPIGHDFVVGEYGPERMRLDQGATIYPDMKPAEAAGPKTVIQKLEVVFPVYGGDKSEIKRMVKEAISEDYG